MAPETAIVGSVFVRWAELRKGRGGRAELPDDSRIDSGSVVLVIGGGTVGASRSKITDYLISIYYYLLLLSLGTRDSGRVCGMSNFFLLIKTSFIATTNSS